MEDTPRPRNWSEKFPGRPCAAPARRHRTSLTHSSGRAGSVRTKIRTTVRQLAGEASRRPGDEVAGVGVRTGSVGSVTSTDRTKGPCDSYSQGPFTYLRIDCATAYGPAPMPAPASWTRMTHVRPRTVRSATGNRPQEMARTCAQLAEPVDESGLSVDGREIPGEVPGNSLRGARQLERPLRLIRARAFRHRPGERPRRPSGQPRHQAVVGRALIAAIVGARRALRVVRSLVHPGQLLHRNAPSLCMNEHFLWTGMRLLWTDRPFPDMSGNSFRKGLCGRPATA